MEDRDFEKEALQDGWSPKEEWKGDPEQWVDAKEFVERGENIRPILQANNRKLRGEVEKLNQRVDELLQTNAEVKNFMGSAVEKERKEKEKLVRELEEARSKAVSDGDGEAFDRADRQLKKLQEAPQQDYQPSPEMAEWMRDNSWYDPQSSDYDVDRAAMVDGALTKVLRTRPDLKGTGRRLLEACVDEAKKMNPSLFGEERKTEVEAPNRESRRTKGRTFDDLPDDAKAAYERFARDIPEFSKEEYVANYDWESE